MKFCSNNEFTNQRIFSNLPDVMEQLKSPKNSVEKSEKFLLEYSIYDYTIILQFEHMIETFLKLFTIDSLESFISDSTLLVEKKQEENVTLKITLYNVYNSKFCMICKNVSHPVKLSTGTLTPFRYEYNLSLFTTNSLRKLCPHFGYTFGNVFEKKNNVSIIQEYIEGDTLDKYLSKRIHKPNHCKLSRQFLSIFVQTIAALEVAQQSLQFTHHDFHYGNLILRKISNVNQVNTIKIMDSYYHFENVGLCPTIIDFERSTSRYKKDCIFLNTYMDHLKFGYVGFFVAGIDVLRFLFSIYSIVMISEAKKEFGSFGFKIFNFVEYIFEHFYKIKSPILDKEAFKYHWKHFFNMTHHPQVFLTPFELMQFIEEHKNKLCRILQCDSFPWTVKPNNISTRFMFSTQYELQKDNAFLDVLCLKTSYKDENSILYKFMNDTIVKVSEKDFMVLLDKLLEDYEYPSLYPEHVDYLKHFYETNSFIIPTYEYYFMHYFIHKDGVGRNVFQSPHSSLYTRLYRTLCSIYALLLLQSKNDSVLSEMKKFNRDRITYIQKNL
jgi:hypothetical protein